MRGKIDRVTVYNLNNQICIRGKAGGKHDHVDVAMLLPGIRPPVSIIKPRRSQSFRPWERI